MNRVLLIVILIFSLPVLSAENPQSPPVDWTQLYGSIDPSSEASLTSALKQNGPLTNWLSLQLSSLYLKSEKYAEVLNLLEKIPAGSVWDFWKQVNLAKTWLGMQQPHQALQTLEFLPSEPDIEINQTQTFYRHLYRDALRTKEQALERMGKSRLVVSARIWALFPDIDNDSIRADPASAVSAEIAPGATTADKTARLHVLHTKKLFDSVPALIRPDEIAASRLPLADKCRALFEWGNSLRNLQKTAEALDGFSRLTAERCDGEHLVRSLYWKGKLELAFKKTDRAVETYEYLIKKFPSGRYTDDAWYALWKIHEGQNQEGRAKKTVHQLIGLSEGDMRIEALWEMAWPAFKKGKYKEAMEHLDVILASKPGNDEAYPRALYWKGRTLEKIGGGDQGPEGGDQGQVTRDQGPKALSHGSSAYAEASADRPVTLQRSSGQASHWSEIYQRLINDFPFSYYAVIAANRLGVAPKIPQIPHPSAEVPLEARSQETIITVNLLNKSGLSREALGLLDYFSQQHVDLANQMKPLMAVKWVESGDYNKALAMASDHFGHGVTEGMQRREDPMLFALYPFAYAKEVAEANRRLSLPRGMIEGIMREESLFLPEVRSSAGAVGVMQLMPGTASMQAKSMSMTGFSMDHLTNPKTNILLGSTFFAKLMDRYQGRLPLAIMAYNAGPGNVNKWLKSMGRLPLDEFVEEIPFSETRGYVKRVLRSMQTYGLLLDEPEFKRPFFSLKL